MHKIKICKKIYNKICTTIGKIISVMIICLVMSINVTTCSAAGNFTFVDAEDDTGYYVDMDTVKIENANFITATIAVIKANLNKMYIYDVRINHKERVYQINSSKIIEYDTRTVVEANDKPRAYRPYSSRSQMSELVKFILYGDE